MSIPLTDEWIARYSQPGPRYTSYPTAVEFHQGVTAADYEAHLRQANEVDEPLSLYMHLPFCEERCLFCACHTVITKQRGVANTYLSYLEREIDMVAERLPDRHRYSQLHWGGGTPTYYQPEQLARLMRKIGEHFVPDPNAELAIEVDPCVTTLEHIDALLEAGFNRYSLGVQDINPQVQAAVNRVQPVEQTDVLLQYLRDKGVDSINVDLICGLPHQTLESFARTVKQVIRWAPARIAMYAFAYVPWMKGHQKKLPTEALPGARLRCELQFMAREELEKVGYLDIGMDHFALPDDPMAVAQREGRLRRNFMGYTVLPAPDLLGFGVSSIGDVRHGFFQTEKKLSRYYDAIEAGRLPTERGILLNRDDRIRQDVIEQLMCNFSLSIPALEEKWGISFASYFAEEAKELEEFAEEKMVTLSPTSLQVTSWGKLLIRRIARVFDHYLRTKAPERPTFSKTL